MVFLPGPMRVATVTATVGAPLPAGTAIVTVTSTRPQVTVALETAMQQLVRRGDRVQVILPDGRTTRGTVATVSRVATQPGTGSGQNGGQDQGEGGNGSGSGQATVQVTVRLANPKAAGNLDQAPVQVAITTQAAQGVLAVPINALLAQPGGGYAVALVAGGASRRVAVRTGLFDETAGLVEVQGAGLAEGAKVWRRLCHYRHRDDRHRATIAGTRSRRRPRRCWSWRGSAPPMRAARRWNRCAASPSPSAVGSWSRSWGRRGRARPPCCT